MTLRDLIKESGPTTFKKVDSRQNRTPPLQEISCKDHRRTIKPFWLLTLLKAGKSGRVKANNLL